MPFSIVLFFDTRSDLAVQKLGQSLEKVKVPSIFSTLGATPHLTLAVFEQYEPRRIHAILKKLAADYPAFPFRLSSIGTFPGREGALFLAPVVTQPLLDLHVRLHRVLDQAVEGSWIYYFPEAWVPHCTLSIHLSAGKMARGVDLLRRKGFSVRGFYGRLALMETHSVRIKPIRLIYCVPLSGKKNEVKNG